MTAFWLSGFILAFFAVLCEMLLQGMAKVFRDLYFLSFIYFIFFFPTISFNWQLSPFGARFLSLVLSNSFKIVELASPLKWWCLYSDNCEISICLKRRKQITKTPLHENVQMLFFFPAIFISCSVWLLYA